ncbi:MFS general substrate transporter [Hypoxylon crocopeplum]|nr:MFS general substrate transporter [Hypoxylon crocopeplum]
MTSCALQPLGGKVYSKLNSKWAFITYLILFEVGSVICGTASSSTMLIVGRGVAGIGGSGLLNGALIILNSSVPPHRQPGLVGIMMGIGQLGIAFGPLIGGAFTEWVTWRWCFYLNLPIGAIIALTVLFIRIPDHIVKPSIREVFKHAIMDFDLPGFVLFAPAAIMLFLALQYGGNQFAWNSIEVIGLFCGAGVTFVVWLVWDWYQGDNAMVPFSMMRKRIVWMVFGITAGVLIQRIGYFTPLLLAGSALNAVGCGLLSLLTPNTPTGYWIGFQIIMGTGRGLAMAVPFLAIQNSLEKDMIPAAMSTLVFLQNFSAAVMVVFAQTILTNSLVSLVPQNAPGVDPQLVISVGTTSGALERVVGAAQLPGVLWAYSKSLQRIWYFAGCLGIPPFLVGWCLGWVNIRKKAKDTELDRSVETLEA